MLNKASMYKSAGKSSIVDEFLLFELSAAIMRALHGCFYRVLIEIENCLGDPSFAVVNERDQNIVACFWEVELFFIKFFFKLSS